MAPRKSTTYGLLLRDLGGLLEQARRTSVRSVNAIMTATYWETGRRIVEFEQGGRKRAEYGEALLEKLSVDLSAKFGRGFSRRSLQDMRSLYLVLPAAQIWQTLSAKLDDGSGVSSKFQTLSEKSAGGKPAARSLPSGGAEKRQALSARSSAAARSTLSGIFQTPSENFGPLSRRSIPPAFTLSDLARAFPLPWSHYVLLLRRSRSPEAFAFYHAEALRGGWSVRQLDRQMAALFYERAALSKNKAAVLQKGARPQPGDAVSADEAVRDPLVLEFLNLKDEYSESDLEEALVRHLEKFLLELGGDFAFVGRQRRLRIGDEWYRVDLLFFRRRLRSLVVVDLKLGKFTHADAGQMHLYLNYARAHWTRPGENPPVGLILCTSADAALARYALDGLPSKVLAREYQLALPKEKLLAAELEKTRHQLESRRP
jgi:predicted nuclease of restriction endonuclease-like (RecB) superfamily